MIIVDFWQAMKAGKVIKNPAVWKNRQVTSNKLVLLVIFSVSALQLFGVNIPLETESIKELAGGLAAILGVINTILTVATTTKVSITGKIHED